MQLGLVRMLFVAVIATLAHPLAALDTNSPFSSIDGGTLRLSDWAGQPVLVVNTASLCGFTDQFADLQALYDRYRNVGLIVLAVPSNDFRQELDSNEEVQAFCELTYGIDLPMTEITSVRGKAAHPFYASLRAEEGFVPRWNFNKVLLDGDGTLVATFRSRHRPLSPAITSRIEGLLQ